MSKFHNYSAAMLADAYGKAKALADAAVAEADAIKAHIKSLGLTDIAGDEFSVTVTEQIQARPDVPALKAELGDNYSKFEKPVVSNVLRVKAVATARLKAA